MACELAQAILPKTSRRLIIRQMTESPTRRGQIRDAVEEVLAEQTGPASPSVIHLEVERKLHRQIPKSSVRSSLRLREGSTIGRTARGQYLLLDSPALPVTQQSKLAGQWGKARLFEGDCNAWLSEAPDNSIHAVVTDPPYGLREYAAEEQRKLRAGHGGVWRIPPSFDGHQRSPLPRFTVLKESELQSLALFFRTWARRLYPKLVPGAHVILASNPLLSYLVAGAIADGGFERRGEIVRLVMTMRGGDRPKNAHEVYSDVSVMPRSMWEPWLLFRKPLDGRVQDNLARWGTGGLRRKSENQPFGDVIQSRPASRTERSLAPHPSLKPQSFLRQVVRAVLPLGTGVVLDPFAGSGSTLAAAEYLGYESIGVESDPHYVQVASAAIPMLAALPS